MPGYETQPTRRALLMAGTAVATLAGVAVLSRLIGPAGATTIEGKPGKVTVQRFTDMGEPTGSATLDKVVKSEEEWRKQLTDIAFRVTRQEGTEQAFTGPYWDNHAPGLYRCVCCDNALFKSETKYDSGTGWPSFYQPIAKENVAESSDRTFGMLRTAVSCALCDAHLGHVFDDGPAPTGLRYCMNGVALRFIARPAA
jgi:peptide-methionine (R)-S-oxide reductase